ETFLTVLDEFGAFRAVIDREWEGYLTFLATTRILMGAVRAGVRRETAHEVIKEDAVAVALKMSENAGDQDFQQRWAADDRLPMSKEQLEEALADKHAFIGAGESQVDAVLGRIKELADQLPKAAAYTPGEIL